MTVAGTHDVRFVRWPVQQDQREKLREAGVPCLLIVEAQAAPPPDIAPSEDWVRPPIGKVDVDARVRTLRRRTGENAVPVLDPAGVLHYAGDSVAMSDAQSEMMKCFIAKFDRLTWRQELKDALLVTNACVSSNALDLQIMRLRERLSALQLRLRTVWGRGYILERCTPWACD